MPGTHRPNFLNKARHKKHEEYYTKAHCDQIAQNE